ncbi:LOW QUALITY PROTEIN: hypothetical protein Smp_170140 [Schistosoma mansoni]|uniref:hypothetical protein n=1 Tax=Schistosoma mansoni TaxID=6183 RepID=UPI00022C840C|nr:LOW QUALITY PROTEIN: hypothetical protein Smp_170140 [Schistosoma mansoni]|eukprot:XP_018646105.1 LOW QUALITY PROTEIN: hypothetical protein Smp_170140 [Schistosoma mansoni]
MMGVRSKVIIAHNIHTHVQLDHTYLTNITWFSLLLLILLLCMFVVFLMILIHTMLSIHLLATTHPFMNTHLLTVLVTRLPSFLFYFIHAIPTIQNYGNKKYK